MPVTRKLISQHNEDCQVLGVDFADRYIVNDTEDWQFLFGPNSILTNSAQIIKIAAELDTDTLDSIRFTAYLYNQVTGNVDSGATCNFAVYRVAKPGWDDVLITNFSGTVQSNAYFYGQQLVTALSPAELDGDTTLMVEATITRLSKTYRDRVYINSLGVFESIIRLRNDVEFLDITKLDE